VLFPGQPLDQVALAAGLLFAVHGVGQLVTQLWLIGAWVERFGEVRLVIFGALLRALALWTFALLPHPLSVGTIGMLGFAVGSGIMMPALQSLVTQSVPEDVSGAVLGVYQSVVSLGVIAGAIMSGFLFAQSPFLPYLVAGIVVSITLLPSTVLFRVRAAAPMLETGI
jgi:ACDE family multidrug resistance protein